MNEAVTIYAIVDPRDGLPFYVGQTVQPLKSRLSCHISYRSFPKGGIMETKRNRLLEIIKEGHYPEILPLKVVAQYNADIAERKFYRKMKRKGYLLLQNDLSVVSTKLSYFITQLSKKTAKRVKKKAEKEGKTLSHKIEELLLAYVEEGKRKPSDQLLG